MTNLEFFVLSDYKYEVINFTFYFYVFFFTSIIYIQILSFTQILHKKNITNENDHKTNSFIKLASILFGLLNPFYREEKARLKKMMVKSIVKATVYLMALQNRM